MTSAVFESYASVMQALEPAIVDVSFHDGAGDVLWMRRALVAPDEHALVATALRAGVAGDWSIRYELTAGSTVLAALPVSGSDGRCAAVVLLHLDVSLGQPLGPETPDRTLAALLKSLVREIEQSPDRPSAPGAATLEAQIEAAVMARRFTLFLQPIVALQANNAPEHYEILLRLCLPDGSVLAPQDFFPTIERCGLEREVDQWVVQRLIAWLGDNRPRWAGRPRRFAVNLNARSVASADLCDEIIGGLSAAQLPTALVCLEIPATRTAVKDPQVMANIERLRHAGCIVSIDDVACERMAAEELSDTSVDVIKIEGACLSRARVSDRDAIAAHEALRSLVAQGAEIVAEAVETADDLDMARDLGCDYAQGYLFGKPQRLESFDFRIRFRALDVVA
ncbi:MAG: EAL domain-containing protein [Steroidobacteraceae bacterium]